MIPVNEPLLGERERENVLECLRTGWISSSGPFIDAFENSWATYCGRRYGIAVCNGTVALQAAIAALRLEEGDEIILPSFTIVSCITAVLYNRCVPILIDSDPSTWCMDVNQIEAAITPRTRAIMVVHIYGHPVDMDPVMELALRHHLAVIEDAAEAHGAEHLSGRDGPTPTWRRCGSFGEASCFSFYANKLITTGEGGMVLTDDTSLAERLRSLRNLCFNSTRRFRHEELGFNFRLTNLQAALALGQIERMDGIVARKQAIGQEYTRLLSDLPCLQLPPKKPWAKSVYWMYGLVVDEKTGLDAQILCQRLLEKGIETRPFFFGMHEQPVLRRRGLFLDSHFPVTERLARQGFYLPSGLALTAVQMEQVSDAIHEVVS